MTNEKLTDSQRAQWTRDRARQATIYTFTGIKGSLGDLQRRANNGVALRTYRWAKFS